jgi:hypothetical protein
MVNGTSWELLDEPGLHASNLNAFAFEIVAFEEMRIWATG